MNSFKKCLAYLLLMGVGGALTVLGQSPSGTAPEILLVDFPKQIRADGSLVAGLLGFRDPDGDLARADFAVMEATDFQPVSLTPNVKGKTEGAFEFKLATRTPQRVTLRVTLTDEAGNKSASKDFSFVAVATTLLKVPEDYPTLQAAVAAAQPGDTVQVASGTYRENLSLNKSLTVRGEAAERVNIQAAIAKKPVLQVNSGEILLEGVTISGGLGSGGDGVQINARAQATIRNSVVRDNEGFGIWVRDNAQALVESATISGNGVGPNLGANGVNVGGSGQMTVRDSTISGNGTGFWIFDNGRAVIERNIIARNGHPRFPGGGNGIMVHGLANVEIRDNQIVENKGWGVGTFVIDCHPEFSNAPRTFAGKVSGANNEITNWDDPKGNTRGDVCTADLVFLKKK